MASASSTAAAAGGPVRRRAVEGIVDGKLQRVVVEPVAIANDEELAARAAQFADLDDRLRGTAQATAIDRRKKAVIAEALCDYTQTRAHRTDDGAVIVPTDGVGGSLTFREKEKKSPLTRDAVVAALHRVLGKDDPTVERVVGAIFDDREGESKWSMRRARPRGGRGGARGRGAARGVPASRRRVAGAAAGGAGAGVDVAGGDEDDDDEEGSDGE